MATETSLNILRERELLSTDETPAHLGSKDLAEAQILLNTEAGILQDPNSQTAPQVSTRMHGDGRGDVPLWMPKGQMTTGLPLFDEALRLQKGDDFTCRNLRHPAHAGIPSVSSST